MALAIDIQTFLTAESHSLTLLFIGVILLSYLLEDVAIVTAATLALQNLMPPGLALLAIFVGIVSGDLGLYYLGQVAQRVRPLRYQALTNKHFRTVRRKLHHHTFLNLFIIRFVPGLRTVGFTLSGFYSSIDFPDEPFFYSVGAISVLRTDGHSTVDTDRFFNALLPRESGLATVLSLSMDHYSYRDWAINAHQSSSQQIIF